MVGLAGAAAAGFEWGANRTVWDGVTLPSRGPMVGSELDVCSWWLGCLRGPSADGGGGPSAEGRAAVGGVELNSTGLS